MRAAATMGKAYVIIKDEGSHSDRDWEIVAVCSSAESAEETLCSILVQTGGTYDPYYVDVWTLDGGQADEDEGRVISERAGHAARQQPAVAAAVARRAAVEQAKADARARRAADAVRLERRRVLDDRVLAGELTVEEYREAVDRLQTES